MILLTGATGYIGSHIWIELLKGSIPVVGIDNLSNSKLECLDAVSKIAGESLTFFKGDIRDVKFLVKIFTEFKITYVIHLAALKDIPESMTCKDEYFDVNVVGLQNLLKVMRDHNCQKIIFSSSAAVYGESANPPVSEDAETSPSNYYGYTKLDCENLLAQEFFNSPSINSVSLRYFNVAGRHSSGMLPDFSLADSHSLFAEIEKVLQGRIDFLSVFGDDWDTPDGTCIRDYIHISDLVKGHLDTLNLLDRASGLHRINLGMGAGRSVYEVISSFERAVGIAIPKKIRKKRVGDIAVSFADTRLANQLIAWRPTKTLADISLDSLILRSKE
jgi:UDP-glucose 4-epimerase